MHKKSTKKFAWIVILISSLLVTGCSFNKGDDNDLNRPLKVGPELAPANQVPLSLSRESLLEKLKSGGALNTARLVEIYAQTTGRPEHRILDVREGSIYSMIGIKDKDLIIAANDYYIYSPPQFFGFIPLIPNEKEASVTVRRNGQVIKYTYTIAQEEAAPVSATVTTAPLS